MTQRYRLTRPRRPIDLPDRPRPTAVVWVDAPDYDEDGVLCAEGECELVRRIFDALDASYGNRGRPLRAGEPLTPRDLAVALDSPMFRAYEPAEVE